MEVNKLYLHKSPFKISVLESFMELDISGDKIPCVRKVAVHIGCGTWSDSKVMRLVPKKSFILCIYQPKYGHLQCTSLVPAHTFSSSVAVVCSIPGTQLEECRFKACVTDLCLSSVDSKWCPFTADFAF
jgi:hypothetical protein